MRFAQRPLCSPQPLYPTTQQQASDLCHSCAALHRPAQSRLASYSKIVPNYTMAPYSTTVLHTAPYYGTTAPHCGTTYCILPRTAVLCTALRTARTCAPRHVRDDARGAVGEVVRWAMCFTPTAICNHHTSHHQNCLRLDLWVDDHVATRRPTISLACVTLVLKLLTSWLRLAHHHHHMIHMALSGRAVACHIAYIYNGGSGGSSSSSGAGPTTGSSGSSSGRAIYDIGRHAPCAGRTTHTSHTQCTRMPNGSNTAGVVSHLP